MSQYLFHATIPQDKTYNKVNVTRDEHGMLNMTCDEHVNTHGAYGCVCVNKLKSAINPFTEFVKAVDSPTGFYGLRIKNLFENWDDVSQTVKETRGY